METQASVSKEIKLKLAFLKMKLSNNEVKICTNLDINK